MPDNGFTRDNIDFFLKEVAKEYRKLAKKMPAEVILVGGASVIINYGFRKLSYDIDADVRASDAMKQAVNKVTDEHNLANGWLNSDFKNTASYSSKIREVSIHYRTFSNIVEFRTISAEYLIAIKLMSGRQYKNDLSDVVGILYEQQQKGEPISLEKIKDAFEFLYEKDWNLMPESSQSVLLSAVASNDLLDVFNQIKQMELSNKEFIEGFQDKYPDVLCADNVDDVINAAKKAAGKVKSTPQRESLDERLAKVRAAKETLSSGQTQKQEKSNQYDEFLE